MSGALSRIAAVAHNTLRESLRNRIVYALVGGSALVMGASLLLGWVAVEDAQSLKIVADFSMSTIAMFGTLTSIFLGTNLIYQEIERKTAYTLLARPLTRTELIIGKFAGLCGVNVVCVAGMTCVFFAVYLVYGGGWHPSLGIAIYLVLLELAVVTAIALLFSVIAHPIQGAVFALVVALAGHATGSLLDLGKEIALRSGATFTTQLMVRGLRIIYAVLPDLESFNVRSTAASLVPIELGIPALATAYAVCYCGVLVVLAALALRRKVL